MDYFNYRNNELFAEDVSINAIADVVNTPFYCYSQKTLSHHFKVFSDAFSDVNALVCYALKANSNLSVVKTLAALGAGADVVSKGELLTAMKAGISPDKIVFSGVGKTKEEHGLALKSGILQINVESEAELIAINETAGELGVKAPIAFRINPDVDAHTHAKITTGKKENKFGIEWDKTLSLYQMAASLKNIEIVGVDIHIGSQLTELEPFDLAFAKLAGLVQDLESKGIVIKNIDLGGGLGVPYNKKISPPPLPINYAAIVKKHFAHADYKIILEPGRMITGNAGILVGRVIYVKENNNRIFLITDIGMNDIMRPALYDARHSIIEVKSGQSEATKLFDVVGPICETGDIVAKDVLLADNIKAGDLIAIETAGAYGASMSSSYNSRLLIPEVMVSNDKFAIIRRRPSYDEMKALEDIPEWF